MPSIPFYLCEADWGGPRPQGWHAHGGQTLLVLCLVSAAPHPTSCCWVWFELWLTFALGQSVGWSCCRSMAWGVLRPRRVQVAILGLKPDVIHHPWFRGARARWPLLGDCLAFPSSHFLSLQPPFLCIILYPLWCLATCSSLFRTCPMSVL